MDINDLILTSVKEALPVIGDSEPVGNVMLFGDAIVEFIQECAAEHLSGADDPKDPHAEQ